MAEPNRSEVTRILQGLDAGAALTGATSPDAECLFAMVYDELRGIARRIMSRERVGHTLQPTALVHEVYLKLVDQDSLRWNDRAHFLSIAARAMRQILVDHARRRGAEKRGGEWQRVTLDQEVALDPGSEVELIDLDQALEKLSALDARASRVAELRLFGGLSVPEAAHVLGVSARTIDGDWAMARMWLSRELEGGAA